MPGLTKLIVLGLLIWLGLRVYRAIQRRQLQKTTATPKQISGDLVQCANCGVHLPIETARKKNGGFYCPPENQDCTR